MHKQEGILSAALSILLGILLIVMKNSVISIAITVCGVVLLISAVMEFIAGMVHSGIIKAVVGVCVLVFGWMFVNLALYILAAAIIIMGLMQIVNIHKYAPVNQSGAEKVVSYLRPVAAVIAGACLLFNQGGTVSWLFVFAGVLLIVQGAVELLDCMKR
ncbi:MAG: DUF308 domain-containing protein [Eubacteriales bacterium]